MTKLNALKRFNKKKLIISSNIIAQLSKLKDQSNKTPIFQQYFNNFISELVEYNKPYTRFRKRGNKKVFDFIIDTY